MTAKTLRECPEGHKYYKSTDCPTCPICENKKIPTDNFMSALSAPACRALRSIGINSVEKLSHFSEKEIMSLHGMGKASLPKMLEALQDAGLTFKKMI